MMNDVNRQKLEKLIEAVIHEVLAEQDIMADDPWLKVFVQPFTDVIKTANAEIKKNLINVRGNVKSLAKQAALLAIPFLAGSMIKDTHDKAQAEIKQKLGAIDSQYADVFQRNWDTLRSRDVWGIHFLLNPAMGITSKFAMKAPLATLNVLETVTAGGLSPKNQQRLQKAKAFASKFAKPVSPNYSGGGPASGGDWGGMGGDLDMAIGFGESTNRLREQQATTPAQQPVQQQQPTQRKQPDQQEQLKKLASFVEAFKKQPDVQAALQNSKVAKALQQSAYDAVTAAAAPVLQASNYQQLSKALGAELQKFEAQVLKDLPKDIKPEEEKQFKEALVPQIKQAYKDVLTTQLAKSVTGDPAADKSLQTLITKIKQV